MLNNHLHDHPALHDLTDSHLLNTNYMSQQLKMTVACSWAAPAGAANIEQHKSRISPPF
jgi:hypothetical protein